MLNQLTDKNNQYFKTYLDSPLLAALNGQYIFSTLMEYNVNKKDTLIHLQLK